MLSSWVPSMNDFITETGAEAFLAEKDAAGIVIVPSCGLVVIGAGGAGGWA